MHEQSVDISGRILSRRRLLELASLTVGGIGASSLLAACGGGTAAPVATATAAASSAATTNAVAAAIAALPAMKVKFGTADPAPPAQRSKMVAYWQDLVTQRTNGKITFDNYFSGSLVAQGDLLEGIQNRVVDAATMSASWSAGKLPIWSFEFIFPDRPADPVLYNKVMHDLTGIPTPSANSVPYFIQEYGKYKVTVLNLTPMEEGYDIFMVKPALTLADLKGKKIATPAGYMQKYIAAAGAVPVTVPAPARYQALQSGVIDGHVLSLQFSSDFKLTEIANKWLKVGLGNTSPGGLVLNSDFLASLPAPIQKILTDAGVEAETYLFKLFQDDAANYLANFQKISGSTTNQMSAADITAWFGLMEDYPAQWALDANSQGLPGWQVVDGFIKAAKADGYVFRKDWGKH